MLLTQAGRSGLSGLQIAAPTAAFFKMARAATETRNSPLRGLYDLKFPRSECCICAGHDPQITAPPAGNLQHLLLQEPIQALKLRQILCQAVDELVQRPLHHHSHHGVEFPVKEQLGGTAVVSGIFNNHLK